MANEQITLYFVPKEHTTTPSFGEMHINPVIAFRRSSKVLIANKIINVTLGKTAKLWGL